MSLLYKTAVLSDLTVKEAADSTGETGVFEGYASKFGNVDSYGDIVIKGAFTESLATYKPGGAGIPCYWAHRMDDPEMCIGETLAAVEDEIGLKVTVQLDIDSNPKAARAYELIKAGRVAQMSFAYQIDDAELVEHTDAPGGEAYELRKLTIFEVSIVQIGANTETEITDVKNAVTRLKAGRKISAANAELLAQARDLINKVIDATDDDGSSEEPDDDTAQERETAKAQDRRLVKERTLSATEAEDLKKHFTWKGSN